MADNSVFTNFKGLSQIGQDIGNLAGNRMALELKEQQVQESRSRIEQVKGQQAVQKFKFIADYYERASAAKTPGFRRALLNAGRESYQQVAGQPLDAETEAMIVNEEGAALLQSLIPKINELFTVDPAAAVQLAQSVMATGKFSLSGTKHVQQLIESMQKGLDARRTQKGKIELERVKGEVGTEKGLTLERQKQKLIGERETKIKLLEVEQNKAKNLQDFKKTAGETARQIQEDFGDTEQNFRGILNIAFERDEKGRFKLDKNGKPISRVGKLDAFEQFFLVQGTLKAATDPRITDGERKVAAKFKPLIARWKPLLLQVFNPDSPVRVDRKQQAQMILLAEKLTDARVKGMENLLAPTFENISDRKLTGRGILSPFQRNLFVNKFQVPEDKRANTFDLFFLGQPRVKTSLEPGPDLSEVSKESSIGTPSIRKGSFLSNVGSGVGRIPGAVRPSRKRRIFQEVSLEEEI